VKIILETPGPVGLIISGLNEPLARPHGLTLHTGGANRCQQERRADHSQTLASYKTLVLLTLVSADGGREASTEVQINELKSCGA
jgi:hypothetical protein